MATGGATMTESHGQTSVDGRRAARVELDEQVTIRFEAGAITGSGRNISAQGVFFTADAALPVIVQIAGRADVRGRLVRLESMGDGRIGVAVRFDEEAPVFVPAG
jgi:hypothetical protein